MLVSTKGRYALRVMLELAQDDSAAYLPLPAIAERQGISEKYLESIISVLSKAGLVDGLRGKGGGYRLNRPAADYSVGQILRLTEGSLAPVTCLEGDETPAPAPVTAPRSPCGKSWMPSSTTIWTVSPWPIC